MTEIYFDDMGTMTDLPSDEVIFDDEEQSISTEHWEPTQYAILRETEVVEDKKEYFKRKLKGE